VAGEAPRTPVGRPGPGGSGGPLPPLLPRGRGPQRAATLPHKRVWSFSNFAAKSKTARRFVTLGPPRGCPTVLGGRRGGGGRPRGVRGDGDPLRDRHYRSACGVERGPIASRNGKEREKKRGRKTNKGREGTKRPPVVLKRSPKEAVEVKEFRILTGR